MSHLCRWLGVSKSGFYDWLKRPPSPRSQADADLGKRIEIIHEESQGIYGSPRVFRVLRKQGVSVGRKRVVSVERLMRERQLQGRVVRVTRRCPGLKRFVASGVSVVEYIEFYNRERLHSGVSYQSPENYEKLFQ